MGIHEEKFMRNREYSGREVVAWIRQCNQNGNGEIQREGKNIYGVIMFLEKGCDKVDVEDV